MRARNAARVRKTTVWCWERAHWLFPFAAAAVLFKGQLQTLAPVLLPNGDNTHHLMSQFNLLASYNADDCIWGPLSADYGMPLLRFYQPLFYLVNLGLQLLTAASPMLLQNAVVTAFFTASPLSFCYGIRKIGLPRFAAGIASLVAMSSVAGFGNSIEAFHGNGILTQSLAAFFFPLFLGTFAGFLRGENRMSTAAILFALTFLSHVVMAVLAVLAVGLYFLVTPISIRRVWKRVAVFSALVACLVAFWLVPFLSHTVEFRPIPDSEVRVEKRWWFVGASDDELARLAASGRLFDDAKALRPDEKEPLDTLSDQLNITVTRHLRPPVITYLTAWGVLVGLLFLRRPGIRFLVAGFLFSLILVAGQDDHPWLRLVPFINYVQSFRCVYFVEFFAFALIGLGIERPLYGLVCAVTRSPLILRVLAAAAVVAGAAIPSAWAIQEIQAIQEAHIHTYDPEAFDAALSRLPAIPKSGYPYRMDVTEVGGLMRDWLSINGYRMGITHWGKSGPNAPFKAQAHLTAHRGEIAFSRLIGQRYLYTDRRTASGLAAEGGAGKRWGEYRNGYDSPESKASRNLFLDSGQEEFLQPLSNRLVAVRCRADQWIWLVDAWSERYAASFDTGRKPFPVRVRDLGWLDTPLKPLVETVVYLDGAAAEDEAEAIAGLVRDGKSAWVPYEIPASRAEVLPAHGPIWEALDRAAKSVSGASGTGAAITVQRVGNKKRTSQKFVYDIDALEPGFAVLPTVAVPGWRAAIDGEPVEIYSAGPSLVSVALPQGSHRLAFSWQMPLLDELLHSLGMALFAALAIAWLLSAMGAVALRRSLRRTLLRLERSR
jgi:hypothetical protein